MSTDDIKKGELCGYLRKMGAVNKSFKERWFVLKGNRLYYYKTMDSPRPISYISLNECHIRVSPEWYPQFACFDVVTSQRVFQLIAPTSNDMKLWMEGI